MRLKLIVAAAYLVVASLCATAASAANLLVNGEGKLTGATGVMVAGASYDVIFADTTCIALLSGCDSQSDFPTVDGVAAANALLEQVFIGQFDDRPELTLGCEFAETCRALVPTTLFRLLVGNIAENNSGLTPDIVPTFQFSAFPDFNTDTNIVLTYALFTPSPMAAVPEPGTWAMMLIGFGAIGATMRRRRRVSSIAQMA